MTTLTLLSGRADNHDVRIQPSNRPGATPVGVPAGPVRGSDREVAPARAPRAGEAVGSDAAQHRSLLSDMIRDALELGQPQQALELLDKLWGSDLSREDVWFLRGQALYELQRYIEAGQVTRDGLARLPRSVALLYLLANCELKLGQLAAAEQAILRAIALLPDNPLLLARHANLLGRQERYDEARTRLAEAERHSPGHPIVARERETLSRLESGLVPHAEVLRGAGDLYGRVYLGASLMASERAASGERRGAGGRDGRGEATFGAPSGSRGRVVVVAAAAIAAMILVIAGQPLPALACGVLAGGALMMR